MSKWEVWNMEEEREIIFHDKGRDELVIIDFQNFDFTNYIQTILDDKNIAVYSAAEYIAKDRQYDEMSKLIRENKYVERDFVPEFAAWYVEFLNQKLEFNENNLLTTVPRIKGHRHDHLKTSFEILSSKTYLNAVRFIQKNLDIKIKDWKPEMGKLYSVVTEQIEQIKKSDQIIIFDDVITEASTLKLICEEIREISNREIVWITLTAAWKMRSSTGL